MAAASFGSYNPQATDPSSVELALAQAIAKDTPDLAYPMFANARIQRENQGAQYGQELAQQHAYAQQQLQEQMADNAAKNVAGLLDKPGGARLMATSPALRYLYGGAQGDAVDTIVDMADRGANAKIFKDVAGGAQEAVNAGLDIPATSYGQMTNLPVKQGTPLQLRVAALHEAGSNARAGGEKQPGVSIQKDIPGVGVANVTYGGKTGINTADQIAADLQKRFGVTPALKPPSTPGVTPLQPKSGGTSSAPATPVQSSTRGAAPVQDKLAAALNSGALVKPLGADGAASAAAAAKANGGKPKTSQNANGTLNLLGAKGEVLLTFKP